MDVTVPLKGGRPPGRSASPFSAAPLLEQGQVHEVHCAAQDRAAALAFALTRGQWPRGGDLFLLRVPGKSRLPFGFSGEGLALLGLDPQRLTFVEPASEIDLLRAALDAARCSGVAAVLMHSEGRFADYDLTASRRLVLAAEASHACVLLLRVDAEPRSSAAQTRWSIASAPSVPLATDAPGWPAIDAQLLRRRGGPAGGPWRLIWDAEHGRFEDADAGRAAMSGAVVPFPSLRTDAADGRRVA
jgi:protein ImuA